MPVEMAKFWWLLKNRGRVAEAAVQSALTFKQLEFLSSLVSYIAYIAKGFGPFLVIAGFREREGLVTTSISLSLQAYAERTIYDLKALLDDPTHTAWPLSCLRPLSHWRPHTMLACTHTKEQQEPW